MKIEIGKLWKKAEDAAQLERKRMIEVAKGPRAFCSGTLLPCEAGNRCRHFGVHNCSTFKKHKKNPCPHWPDRGFICTRVD